MTSAIGSVAFLLSDFFWFGRAVADLGQLIFGKPTLALSFMGIGIIGYYGARWQAWEEELDKQTTKTV